MTVETIQDRQYFTGTGGANVFPFNFKFLDNAHIFVSKVDSTTGAMTALALTTDYTLTGVGDDVGGVVTLPENLPSGTDLFVRRIVPALQTTSIRNQERFFPEVHENAFDLLTMLVQQSNNGALNTMQLSPTGLTWDFQSKRGANVATPVSSTDAANKAYVDSQVAGGSSYLAPGSGAVVQTTQNRLRKVVYPDDYGAVGDGTTNDTAAVNAAIASGYQVEGTHGKIYAVSGRITVTSSLFRLRHIRFKQLTPSPSDLRTICYQGTGRVELDSVVVDRNGTGTGGALSDAAGIWIAGATSGYVRNCEVFGNDFGNGIAIIDCINRFLVENNTVRDIRGGTAASAVITDDSIQGIWCQRSSMILRGNRIYNLSNIWTGQAQWPRFTRGISIGGCFDYLVEGNYVNTADQGIDNSGGELNRRGLYANNEINNSYTWGIKFANTANDIVVTGNRIYRPGLAGIVCSAPTSDIGVDTSWIVRRILIANNDIDDPGFGGNWDSFSGIGPCGIMIIRNPTTYPNDPRGIKCRGNKIQAPAGKMKYGIYTDVPATSVVKDWNRGVDNDISDFTIAATQNLSAPVAVRKTSTLQSTTANTNLDLVMATIVQDPGVMQLDSQSFIVRETGTYIINASARFIASATGYCYMRILINGSAGDGDTTGDGVAQFPPNANTSDGRIYSVSKGPVVLVAGTTVRLQVNTGAVASGVNGATLSISQVPNLG